MALESGKGSGKIAKCQQMRLLISCFDGLGIKLSVVKVNVIAMFYRKPHRANCDNADCSIS